MVQNKTILMHDIYSWTMPGVHWYSHEWLWSVLFYAIYKHFGFAGLFWSNVVILALILFVSYFVIESTIGKVLFTITSIIGWGLLYGFFVARALVLATLLLTLSVLVIIKRENLTRKHLLVLALMFVFWANIHSSVVFGVFLIGLFSLIKAIKTREYVESAKTVATVAIASLINPHHIKLYYFFYKLTTARVLTDHINEWLSPNFHNTLLLLLVLVWLVAFVVSIKQKQNLLDTLPFFILGLAMFLSALRNVVYMGLLLGIAFNGTKDDKKQEKRWFSVYIYLLIVTFMFSMNLNHLKLVDEKTMLEQEWAQVFKVVDYMQKNGYTDRVLNEYEFGAYMIFRGIKCAIDSRGDMYYLASPEFTKEYIESFLLQRAPDSLIKKLKAKYILAKSKDSLALYLKAKRYKVLYSDKYSILFKVPE